MTDEQIITEIQWRQTKIESLYQLYNKPMTNVQIWFNDGNSLNSLGQNTFPFNLGNEVRMLVLESIIFYENEIQSLKNQL